MKIKKMLFAAFLTAALLGGNSLFAQSSSYMNLGLNIPQGSFGSKASTCALFDASSTQGGASLGANLGFKFITDTKAKGLGIMFSIDGMYNGLQKSVDVENHMHTIIPEIAGLDIKIKNPSYINMPILFGLNYNFDISNTIGVFAEGGAGINVRFLPPCKMNATGDVFGIHTDYSYEYHYTPKLAFAFQFGGGIVISKAITIGVNYYNLGTSAVTGYTNRYLKTSASSQSITETKDFSYDEGLSTSMLIVRLGIRLM